VHRAEPASGDNGQRAIEKFNELNPDVVILDGQMPVMGGLEAARRIALIAPQATLALLTLHSFGRTCAASSSCRCSTRLLEGRETHTPGPLADHRLRRILIKAPAEIVAPLAVRALQRKNLGRAVDIRKAGPPIPELTRLRVATSSSASASFHNTRRTLAPVPVG
jgi:hypothetical protein